MNDLDRARAKRIRAAEHAEGERTIEVAADLYNALPADMEDGPRITALLIAILAVVDNCGGDRARVAEAATAVASRFPQIELVPA